MGSILFPVIVSGAAVLVLLLLLSLGLPHLRVWPLPSDGGPWHRVRRVVSRTSGAMAGILSLAVLVLAFLDRSSLPLSSPALSVLGAVVAALGGVLGLQGYLQLGPAPSHDQPGPLVSRGPYRFSRNPQYVGAVAVLLGSGVALGSTRGLLAATACSVWFLLAPLAEESWLRQRFGSAYDAYLASAPRYLGRPRRRRAA